MKLALSDIKTNSPRVRQSQDPEKLDELAASIGAFGQAIIPVGVRKNGHGWNLIYGHRRVAAAKQAGLKEIDAIEVEAGDDMLKVFGLTENVVREDMVDPDVAEVLSTIKKESGWTHDRIGKFFGKSGAWVDGLLAMRNPDVIKAVSEANSQRAGNAPFTARHLQKISAGLGADRSIMPAVIKKVGKEGLTSDQARQVAESASEAFSRFGKRGLDAVMKQRYVPVAPDTIKPKGLKAPEPKPMSLLDRMAQLLKDWSALLYSIGAHRTPKEAREHLAAAKQAVATLTTMLNDAKHMVAGLEKASKEKAK